MALTPKIKVEAKAAGPSTGRGAKPNGGAKLAPAVKGKVRDKAAAFTGVATSPISGFLASRGPGPIRGLDAFARWFAFSGTVRETLILRAYLAFSTGQKRAGLHRRVVLAPRCWRQTGDDCFGNRAGDGDKKAGHRGEHEISRNTIVQGMPDRFRCACGD